MKPIFQGLSCLRPAFFLHLRILSYNVAGPAQSAEQSELSSKVRSSTELWAVMMDITHFQILCLPIKPMLSDALGQTRILLSPELLDKFENDEQQGKSNL